jgi:hypothetical protein
MKLEKILLITFLSIFESKYVTDEALSSSTVANLWTLSPLYQKHLLTSQRIYESILATPSGKTF